MEGKEKILEFISRMGRANSHRIARALHLKIEEVKELFDEFEKRNEAEEKQKIALGKLREAVKILKEVKDLFNKKKK